MLRAWLKARWLWVLVPLVAAGCEGDSPPPAPPVESLSACADQANTLQKAPSGQLPCELLPPGFSR
jgi:hypothetical protein